MAVVHKKHEVKPKEAASAQGSGEPKKEEIVVSDTVTETTERIEVIEEVTPEETKSETKTADEPTPVADPLTEFKEKMTEEEKSPISDMPPKKNFMWPILFVVFLALTFLIGIFVYKQGLNKVTEVNVVTLTPTPTIIPEPTIAVDLTKYQIKILNGSKVDGEAGRQKTNLEVEGFTVSSIGNAANSDYTKTIIQAKEAIELAYLNKLKSVLEESFVVGETEELPEDADSNVIIIIGSETN